MNPVVSIGQIEALLVEASKITNHRNFVIVGSLSAVGALVSPPDEMVMSLDADLYPKLDPGRGLVDLARLLGAGSEFFRKHGVYADPLTPGVLTVPGDWESRLIQISFPGGVQGWFMDPNDATIGKLIRFQENDERWVRAGIEAGVVQPDVVERRLKSLVNADDGDADLVRERLSQLLRTQKDVPRFRGDVG